MAIEATFFCLCLNLDTEVFFVLISLNFLLFVVKGKVIVFFLLSTLSDGF